MQTIAILIPKIKPPNVSDIVTTQIQNILKQLRKKFSLNVVWLVFQPNPFNEYSFENEKVIDYHNFQNAIDVIDSIKPDMIINEVRLGINGISFSIASNHKNILNITLSPTGKSELFSTFFSTKSNFQLLFSDKVIADVSENNQKFLMLRYSLHRYSFLINTLKKSGYSFLQILKFISFYPRFQIFSKNYPALHHITSGNYNLCFNSHWNQRLLDAGFSKDTLIFEGDPAFDLIYDDVQKNPQKSNNKIKILFCPTPMHEHGWISKKDEHSLILDIIKKIHNDERFEISLKIHPSSSSFDEYRELLDSFDENIQLYQKENIMDLLKKFDLMLTYGSSNVILNGILSKKPIILFNPNNKIKLSRLSDSKIIFECNSIDKLPSEISTYMENPISDEIFDKYISSQIGKFDGKNSKRIADFLEKVLNKNF